MSLQTFIGVKRIQAEPQERNGKPGYRVVYEPDGYESWSPKDVFEVAYLPIQGHNKLTCEDINAFINASEIHVEKRGGKAVLVEIKFPNGWTDYEMSSCDSDMLSCPNQENYEELGRMHALQCIAQRLAQNLSFVIQWADHGLTYKDK